MSFQNTSGTWVQKSVQQILKKRKLWPISGLNLECDKPKCFNCEAASNCKVYIQGHKCANYIEPKNCSALRLKSRKCDACAHRETICQCVAKKYCVTC